MSDLLKTDKGIGKLVKTILDNPWKFFFGTLLVIGLFVPQMKHITPDFSYRTWFQEGDPLLDTFDAFERRFGNDDSIVIAVHSPSGVFDTETVNLVNQLTRDMWKVFDVIRVDSLSNYNWVHGKKDQILVEPLLEPESGLPTQKFLTTRKKVALNDETVPQYLVSTDAKTAVMFARIKPAIVNYKKAIEDFRENSLIMGEAGTFSKFLKDNKANVSDTSGEDSLLEDDGDSLTDEDDTEAAADDIYAQIKNKRSAYLTAIINKINEREKQDETLANYDKVREIVKDHERLSYDGITPPEGFKADLDDLASDDYDDLLLLLQKNEAQKSADYQRIVNETKDILAYHKITDSVKRATGVGNGDHQFYLTGGVYLSDSFREATSEDLKKMLPLLWLMVIVFLYVNFKRFAGIFLSLGLMILSIISILAVMGMTGFRFNNMTSIVPYILIAVGIADSVHILATYYQFINRGLSKRDAAQGSLTKNFVPTLLTALSTSIGFASFGTSKVDPIASLGILSAIGTIIAWVITYTWLGPMLVKIPAKPRGKKVSSEGDIVTASERATGFTNSLFKFRHPIVWGTTAVVIAAIVISLNHRVNSDPFEYFKQGNPLRTSLEFMEDNVGAAMGVEISIQSGVNEGIKNPKFLKRVEELNNWVTELEDKGGKKFVTKTVSIIEILKSMNRTLNGGQQAFYKLPASQPVTAEQLFLYTMNLPEGMDINDRMTIKNDAMRLTVLWKLHDSAYVLETIDRIKVKANEILKPYYEEMNLKPEPVYVTGKQRLFMSLNPYVVESFTVSIITAVILVSILLMIAFRSFRMGLFAMIPNFVPLILGSAFIWFISDYVDIGVVIVFSVCLGIAVDDTIHFITNYRKHIKEGLEPQAAIARVLTYTAPALVTTTMVLVASFGIFIVASFIPNVNFGVYSAFILSLALLADLTFLPALFMTFKKTFSKL